MLDIPILRDEDDSPGLYFGAHGVSTPWPGCVVYESSDDVTFSTLLEGDTSAIFGTATTILANWTGGRQIDRKNTVYVRVKGGTLSSSTYAGILNSSANAMLLGSEIIQFITATLTGYSNGQYTYGLSGLLRGCRGTEWAMSTHVTNERAVYLEPSGIKFAPKNLSFLGLTYYYKGVTIGKTVAAATSTPAICTGIGLKPFSPVDFRVARDASNDITATWQRRTRLSCKTIGTLGIVIPLGEDSEEYDLEIWDSGSYTTLKRTINVTSPSASYSAAQQTTDFGAPQSTIYCRVYQKSAQVGRGYKLEASG